MQRSLLANNASRAWLPQFGEFAFSAPDAIDVRSGSLVGVRFHAEAHHAGVLGADFTYSAIVTADWTKLDLSVDLQFRISDEGRYGVRLQAGTSSSSTNRSLEMEENRSQYRAYGSGRGAPLRARD